MERIPPQKPSIPPVGYRFHPNDAELVTHFLKNKILHPHLDDTPIAELKFCDFEPWVLPGKSKVKSNDKAWYFFCPRDFKYANSRRSNRRTKAGFWKPTGKLREVKGIRSKEVIGTKKTLVFHEDSHPKSVKTKWIMHEYECTQVQGNFVVCKLKVKPDEKATVIETMAMVPASPSTPESVLTVTSSCGEYEPDENTSADIGNPYSDEVTNESDKHSINSVVCDVENTYSDEVTSCSIRDESEPGNWIPYDVEYHDPDENSAAMTFAKHEFSGEEAYIFKGRSSGKNMSIFCSGEDLEANVAQPSLDVQGPLTFFDDMKMLIDPKGNPNSLSTCNED
ncbi:NAC domain containing protein 3 [Euphorbia peplus]|nr:NAC domain containing protein 3 [Euphorbia peplus]